MRDCGQLFYCSTIIQRGFDTPKVGREANPAFLADDSKIFENIFDVGLFIFII
jgi:hypothetical protein